MNFLSEVWNWPYYQIIKGQISLKSPCSSFIVGYGVWLTAWRQNSLGLSMFCQRQFQTNLKVSLRAQMCFEMLSKSINTSRPSYIPELLILNAHHQRSALLLFFLVIYLWGCEIKNISFNHKINLYWTYFSLFKGHNHFYVSHGHLSDYKYHKNNLNFHSKKKFVLFDPILKEARRPQTDV